MGKILIIGNKQIDNDELINLKINEFDKVIRINRFNNIKETTDRFDIWFVDIHPGFYKLFNPTSLNKYKKSIKEVYLNLPSYENKNYIKALLPKSKIIKTNVSNIKLYNEDDHIKFGFNETNKCRPTTTIIAISYFIELFKNDEIYIYGVDVFDRKNNYDELGYHKNSASLEENYLNYLIGTNKIKIL